MVTKQCQRSMNMQVLPTIMTNFFLKRRIFIYNSYILIKKAIVSKNIINLLSKIINLT